MRPHTDLDALTALFAPRYGPSFLAPPPTRGMAQSIADDLQTMRATPLPVARAEIAESLRLRPCSDPAVLAILDSPEVVGRLAATLERAWHALLAGQWPRLRAICEHDVVHRSGELGRSGWAGALDGLHKRVSWRDGRIELSGRYPIDRISLGGNGLLFVPSVYIWPQVSTHYEEP